MGQSRLKRWISMVIFSAILLLLSVLAIPSLAQGAQGDKGNILEVEAVPGCSAKELQALLDSNADGRYDALVVNIPAGTYKLNSTLYISSGTTIHASKEAYLVKQRVYGAVLEGTLVNDRGGYGGCHDITVDGGVWDSKPVMDGKEGTETFRFIHCSNVTVKNAVLCNVPEGSHLMVFAGTTDALVENCEFYGYGKGRGGKLPKEAIQLDIAHDVGTTPTLQEVLWDELPCQNITVKDCNFHDFSRAFGSHTTVKGIYHKGILLKNNTVRDMSDIAFKLFNYIDTTVEGNTFSNCSWGVFVYTWLNNQDSVTEGQMFLEPLKEREILVPDNCNIIIQKNTFNMGKSTGDAVRVCGSEELPVSGVTVKDNQISGGRYAVFATYAPKIRISENRISGTRANGILLEQECGYSLVQNNTVEGAGGKAAIGIYTGYDDTNVSGNNNSGADGSGILLYDGVKNCIVGAEGKETKATGGNRIVKPGTTGIHISEGCTGNTVQYNKVENTAEAGIWVYSSKNNKILYNSIISPKQAGIHVTGKSSGSTVSNNTVTNPGTDGVRLHESEKCNVVSNTITKPGKNGINVTQKSNKSAVKKNKIVLAGEDGIWISGSTSCTVSSNNIEKYAVAAEKNYGIGIYQSGGTKSANTKVESNVIVGTGKRTGDNAVHVSTSDYVKVSKNKIKTPAGYGIYIYKGKYGKLETNQITKPVKGGIYVTTACDQANIAGNTVITPGDTAVMTYQAKGSKVTGNIVKVTEGITAVRISQSDNTAVKKNKITGATGKAAVWITGSEGCVDEENIAE